MSPLLLTFALLPTGAIVDPAWAPRRPGPIERGVDAEAAALLGRKPPPLPPLRWLDGKARDLAGLGGRVVVIRSFTHTCPFCASTMPALERLAKDYRGKGVDVLGVYHPKPPRPVDEAEVREIAAAFGVTFPVAVDATWSLVRSWWLQDGAARHWTSVTWILDRHGVVRFVHPGGEYHAGSEPGHERCQADEKEIRAAIDRLLNGR